MRIISGQLKGRVVKEKIPEFIRPTTDKVREAVFNILDNYLDYEDLVVADICAGTGMLGFEALSRGCEFCSFVDNNIKSILFIKSLTDNFGIKKDKFALIHNDALKFLHYCEKSNPKIEFDLIFTDPPYKEDFLNLMVKEISQRKLLKNNGIFVAEHDDAGIIITPPLWKKISDKTYGITKIEIFLNEQND